MLRRNIAAVLVTIGLLVAAGGGHAQVAAAGTRAGREGGPGGSGPGDESLSPGWSLGHRAAGWVLTWRPGPGSARIGEADVEFRAGGRPLGRARTDRDRREYRLGLGTAGAVLARSSSLQAWAAGRRVDGPGPLPSTQPPTPPGTQPSAQPSTPAPSPAPASVRPPSRADQVAPELPPNPTDPGEPGPYPTVTGEYELPSAELPGVPDPVELKGVVVAPQGTTGARPLVLFLHGRHQPCYGGSSGSDLSWNWPCPAGFRPIPSYRGFLPEQRHLASWGYTTVSISANSINSQDWQPDDGGAQARSSLIRRHLAHWTAWAGADRATAPDIVRSAPPADPGRILLVGHSRGGEGVNRAAMDGASPPPADADGEPEPVPWTVRGTVLITPTAFGQNPVVDVPALTLLGGCDGDLADLQGQQYVDASRGVGHGNALHAAVYLAGANHNYFNSEWTPGQATAPAWDDVTSQVPDPACAPGAGSGRLTAAEQQATTATYLAAAARLFLLGEDAVRPLLDGTAVRAASAGRARVLSHALGAARTPLVVPDRSLGVTGAGARLCQLIGPDDSCGYDASTMPHAVPFGTGQGSEPGRYVAELTWSAPGVPVTLRPARPVSLADADAVTLRLVVPPGSTGTRVAVAVADDGGRRADLGEVMLDGLPGGSYRSAGWAQEARLPLAAAQEAGVDLTGVATLELTPRNASGQALLLDGWGWRSGTPDPQARPLTRLDLRASGTAEGDDGVRTLQARVTVSGEEPGQIWLLVLDPRGVQTSAQVTVRPGDQSLELPVQVAGNTQHGDDERYWVRAKAVRDVVVGSYGAEVLVSDDDPGPEAGR